MITDFQIYRDMETLVDQKLKTIWITDDFVHVHLFTKHNQAKVMAIIMSFMSFTLVSGLAGFSGISFRWLRSIW